jgi:hypothetical protein
MLDELEGEVSRGTFHGGERRESAILGRGRERKVGEVKRRRGEEGAERERKAANVVGDAAHPVLNFTFHLPRRRALLETPPSPCSPTGVGARVCLHPPTKGICRPALCPRARREGRAQAGGRAAAARRTAGESPHRSRIPAAGQRPEAQAKRFTVAAEGPAPSHRNRLALAATCPEAGSYRTTAAVRRPTAAAEGIGEAARRPSVRAGFGASAGLRGFAAGAQGRRWRAEEDRDWRAAPAPSTASAPSTPNTSGPNTANTRNTPRPSTPRPSSARTAGTARRRRRVCGPVGQAAEARSGELV